MVKYDPKKDTIIYLDTFPAAYQCLSVICNKKFNGKAGPTICLYCGHPYVKWLDFETSYTKKKFND